MICGKTGTLLSLFLLDQPHRWDVSLLAAAKHIVCERNKRECGEDHDGPIEICRPLISSKVSTCLGICPVMFHVQLGCLLRALEGSCDRSVIIERDVSSIHMHSQGQHEADHKERHAEKIER